MLVNLTVTAAVLLVALAAAGGLLTLYLYSRRHFIAPGKAHELFRRQREHLEAAFFDAAARSGKPRGLRWMNCEWDGPVELARDRGTGQLLALAGVTVSFEAIEGGDMEGLPAVGNLRNATAIFFFDGERWRTAGRAVFNLNPDEAIEHFGNQYERVALPPPGAS